MFKRHLFYAVALVFFPFSVLAQTPEWGHPEDIPRAEPVTVGLAGEQPADIVRYLMAEGALSAKVSPRGDQVAFIRRITGEPQLWVTDLKNRWPQQLTFGSGISFFEWQPNGEALLIGRDADGNEREGYYLLSADGTEETQLLAASDAYRVFGMFSRDGAHIFYASTERNGRDFDIYRHSIASSKTTRLFEGHFGYYPTSLNPEGTALLISEARGEDANDLHWLDVNNGKLRPLFQPQVAARYSDFTWLPDGSGFFLSTNEGREYQSLAFYSLEQKKLEFLSTPDSDIHNVSLSASGRYLSWTTNDGGYSSLHVLDRNRNRELTAPEIARGVYRSHFSPDGETLMVWVTGPRTPGDVYTWDLEEGEFHHAVKASLAGLQAKNFVIPESVFFEARDGVRLHGLLYLPEQPRHILNPPVVVNVHGGPTGQARPRFQPSFQYLVNKGIAVFDVNVRGSTGFGKNFTRMDNREKRLDSVRDLVDTAAFLSTDDRVNGERIAVMGGSYGGYMVNAVLGTYPGIYDAGVSVVGVSNWVRALEEASPALKASDRVEYGDIREEKWQEFYREISPINNADKITVPMLFAHGANDPRDPVTESDDIVRTIRKAGHPVKYLRFPDEGHGFKKQKNRVTYHREVAQFLENILKLTDSGSQVAELGKGGGD